MLRLARIIWDYHQLGQEPAPAEVIIAFGTNDLRVAVFAADLYLQGYGSTLVCTGGLAHQGDLLGTDWGVTEAEAFREAAVRRGVPRERILIEDRAINTAENIRFARRLLESRGIRPRNVLLAVKAFMQRRVWGTLAVEWPEMPATMASPRTTLDEYFTDELTPRRVINIMLGDLQRTWIYARRGWSAPQPLPQEVRDAYQKLVALGFTEHLLPEE